MVKGQDRQEIFDRVTAVGWATIDEFYDALTHAGYWDEDAEFDGIVRDRKQRLRKQIQTGTDGKGRPKFESIIEPGPDGTPVRLYKQISMLNPDEFKQAISGWAKRVRHGLNRMLMLQQQALEIHAVQLPFPLELPDSAYTATAVADPEDDESEQEPEA